jgi:hypothetical protein
MENNPAWNAMNRARDLLGVAYLATKGVDHDPCSGILEQFATLIDIIQEAELVEEAEAGFVVQDQLDVVRALLRLIFSPNVRMPLSRLQ